MKQADIACAFTLASGQTVRFNFGVATFETYGRMQGLTTRSDIVDNLTAANPKKGVLPTFPQLATIRKLMFAAATHAQQAPGVAARLNEWLVQSWVEEIGYQRLGKAMSESMRAFVKAGKHPTA